tara:strand:- start:2789 stop:3211 length:423 start_codon:yes stop_codon:yes gene_type:complete
MIYTKIKCGSSNSAALVSKLGQLIVAPLAFSTFYTNQTAVNNIAVNVVPPKTGKCFVITAIVLSGDRSIGASGAITDVFENTLGPTSATITKEIYQDEIAKQTRATIPDLNILVTQGSWVNVKSDDVIVRANISGYYVDA